MSKIRLDQLLVTRGLINTRSQAESYIKLGNVEVAGKIVTKPGTQVDEANDIKLLATERYVSRAGLKLASVTQIFKLDFKDKTVLDVGSSTGGFTDYSLQYGAKKVIAVDVGTNQLHPSLRGDNRIELYEQTDIRNLKLHTSELQNAGEKSSESVIIRESPDIVLIDVSFISLREILPSIAKLISPKSQVIAMVKPQFEATSSNLKHKGVIKNDRMRRDILKDFEQWASSRFIIVNKADSAVAGGKGNLERFYHLTLAG